MNTIADAISFYAAIQVTVILWHVIQIRSVLAAMAEKAKEV